MLLFVKWQKWIDLVELRVAKLKEKYIWKVTDSFQYFSSKVKLTESLCNNESASIRQEIDLVTGKNWLFHSIHNV